MDTNTKPTILITTDLSQESSVAYPHAVKLAHALGATVTLLTYLDTSLQFGLGAPFDTPVVYLPDATDKVKLATADQLTQEIEKHFKDISTVAEVRETTGPVQYAIVDYIKEKMPTYVVMASHGRSGITRTLMGSVAEQVVRRSSVPVLIVPVK